MATLDYGSVVYADPIFERETLNFAGAATWPAGTILGRITANSRLVAYATGASDGSQTPVAVLTYEVVATGVSTPQASVLIGGVVNKERLVILADGNSTNLTKARQDQLRAAGITCVSVADVAKL